MSGRYNLPDDYRLVFTSAQLTSSLTMSIPGPRCSSRFFKKFHAISSWIILVKMGYLRIRQFSLPRCCMNKGSRPPRRGVHLSCVRDLHLLVTSKIGALRVCIWHAVTSRVSRLPPSAGWLDSFPLARSVRRQPDSKWPQIGPGLCYSPCCVTLVGWLISRL